MPINVQGRHVDETRSAGQPPGHVTARRSSPYVTSPARRPWMEFRTYKRHLLTMATANPPGPPAATQGGPPPQQAPMPPATAALLDALPFTPVPYALRDPPPRPPNAPPGLPLLVCKEHGIDLCKQCGVNFGPINISNLYMPMLARGMVPPPPNVPYPNQAEIIKDLREKGNVSQSKVHPPDAMLLIADVFASPSPNSRPVGSHLPSTSTLNPSSARSRDRHGR
jgi:hypothetical protein